MLGIAIPPALLVGAVTTVGASEITGGVKLFAAVLGLIAALATVVSVIYGVKYKVVADAGRQLNATLEERIRTLAHDREDLVAKLEEATSALVAARETIARLEALPNLQAVLELMTQTFERIMVRVEELHAENRAEGDRRLRVVVGLLENTGDAGSVGSRGA